MIASALPRLALRYSSAAPLIDRSYVTIRRRAASGQLPTVPLAVRCRRISVIALRGIMGAAPLEVGGDRLLSGVEVGFILDISPSTASRLIRDEALPTIPWGRSGRRVPLGKLREFVQANTEGGVA
jgi:hypothetical protein